MDALSLTVCITEDGKVPYGDREQLASYLRQLPGQTADILISPKGARRSTAQNALLWGPLYAQVLEKMLLENGYEPEEARSKHHQQQAHYGLLSLHYGTTVDRVSKLEVPNKTSSQLSTKQFTEHVAWVIRHAAKEYGIAVEGIE